MRNDPKHAEFYTALADVLAVFWQFHKARLTDGNISIAYEPEQIGASRNVVPYENPLVSMRRQREAQSSHERNVLTTFANLTKYTLEASWRQFLFKTGVLRRPLESMNPNLGAFHVLEGLEGQGVVPNERHAKFTQRYASELAQRAHRLSQYSQTANRGIDEIVPAGMKTGSHVTAGLMGLMGDHFAPIIPLLLSRVSLQFLSTVSTDIKQAQGLADGESRLMKPNGRSSVNMDVLREYGLSKAVGCPAGLMPSAETRAWLEVECDVRVTKPMLVEYAETMRDAFREHIGEWFLKLDQSERRSVEVGIDTEVMQLLTGERYAQLRADHDAQDAALDEYVEPNEPARETHFKPKLR